MRCQSRPGNSQLWLWATLLSLLGLVAVLPAGELEDKEKEWETALAKGQLKEALIAANVCKTEAKAVHGDESPKAFAILCRVAETQYDGGRFQTAKATLREVVSALGKNPNPAIMAEVEWRRGMVSVAMREFDDAEKSLKYAIDNVSKTSRANQVKARAMTELAWLRIAERKFAEARALCDEALKLVGTSDKADQIIQGRLLSALGVCQSRSGVAADVDSADASFKRAIDAYTSAYSGEYHGIARIRLHQSNHLFHTGQFSEALTMREELVTTMLEKFGKEHLFYAHGLDALGESLIQMLDLARAEQSFTESARIKKALFTDKHAEMVGNELNLAKVFLENGREADANKKYDAALKLAEEKAGNMSLEVAEALMGLASTDSSGRRGDETAARLRRAADIYSQRLGKMSEQACNCRVKVADLLFRQKKIDEATKILEADRAALESAGSPEKSGAYDNLLESLGLIHAVGNRYDQAAECWTKGLDVRKTRRGADDPSTVYLATKLARLKGMQGDWQDTMLDVSRNRHLIDQHLNRALSGLTETEQMLYLEEKERPSYHYSMSLAADAVAFDQSYAEEATSWVLNGKGASMRMVARFFDLVRQSKSPEAKKQIRELMMTRGALAASWSSINSTSPASFRSEKELINFIENIRKKMPELMKKERSLSRDMAISLRAKDQPAKWTAVSEVRARLPEDTVLVEFVKFHNLPFALNENEVTVFGDVYYAIVIPPEGKGPVIWRNLGPAAELDKHIVIGNAAARGLVVMKTDSGKINSKYDFQSATESAAKKILGQLGEEIFGELMPTLSQYKHWILSPDSLLWQTPWPALVTGKEGKYMVQERTITTVLSGRMLTEAKPRTKWSDDPAPVMFTDIDYGKPSPGERGVTPLPGAAREAKGVEPYLLKLAGKKPQVLKRGQATEGAVDKIQGPSIAMFSTHGYCHELAGRARFSPLMLTGLCMADANEKRGQNSGNDGWMTGLEIAGLNLEGTKLVVLSACNTAEGEVKDGEGVASLQLAFHLAGAESVASTLWSVPDQETADLMIQFFKNLSDGMAPPKALCEAQKFIIDDFKSKGRWAHPVLWAAFCIDSSNPAHE